MHRHQEHLKAFLFFQQARATDIMSTTANASRLDSGGDDGEGGNGEAAHGRRTGGGGEGGG
jgi:hypothetical protein